ncbi:glycosyltransferase [Rickettsiaceae bacterium]|nr:glycosyltransferase [Rickettsiaceae bacterium]
MQISVIIASYNHGLYIKEAINSVLTQTYQNFEIIIIDDGSSDNSVEVIKSIQDARIKFFEFSKNEGACKATNYAIQKAKGKYIAIMNSDDVWVNSKLEKQVNYLEKHKNIDAVFSSAEFLNQNLDSFSLRMRPAFFNIFNQKNRSSAEWLNHFFYNGNCLCHPSILIKKDCYSQLGLYNNIFRQLPDFDMWIRFCKQFTLHIMQEKLVKFRILNNNENASAPSVENQIRGRNEHHLIMINFFDGMSIADFKKGFYKHLKNPDFKSDAEFEIEKAFLYLKTMHCIIGIEKLHYFLVRKEYIKILNEKYNFGDKEFQQISATNNSFNIQSDNDIINALIVIFRYSKLKLLKLIVGKIYSKLKSSLK